MKNWIRYALMVVLAAVSLRAAADDTAPIDTVYFYDTWEQMMDMSPVAMLIDPYIETLTPYEVYITTGDEQLNELIANEHLAVTLGDSIWLISSQALRKYFKGDVRKLHGYVPVFFNEKVAFATYAGLSVKSVLWGDNGGDGSFEDAVDYYYFDFLNRKVLKVTPETLIDLLEDYHDLQMRYEGMRDYKKRPIIKEYFYRYVDRATRDFMRPYILDLVNDQE